ncbi:malignant fibrous histiocytoma-amplified sequence 1-like [Myxocyprinus asiaticus]|uniref:malignant fibrous histiocytoma-amplified sequence 1-like n=1 Tax=Myxocyprinus asiaticus TaxID=70543 RepID=UPI002223C1F7|nr:malignant fibrous histiocytoma-amplified sequence 1-like [Myxocyprinus asiaticus]
MLNLNGRQNGKKEEDYAGKKLKALPTELLQRGQDAVKVDLQRNRLKQITGISQLLNLTELNLSRNEMTDFPSEIKALCNLVKLYMNQNKMKTIPENVFPSLERLQFLKLSTNQLDTLPQDMNKCQSLTYLNLSNNCLRNLEPLVGLPCLKELYVERNQLAELPDLLFQNNCLTHFKAIGNPLRKPPEEVCAGGLRDVQNYFSMLEENSSDVYTVKTMFLGSSMAGKSTLCRSLKQGCPVPVAEADRTIGIEISEVESDGIRFYFWDFAGQEEYYITHHVFITAQAFVILAIDLASYQIKNPQSFNEKVGFWIRNIQLKIPDSVVLLVGTHVDQCTNETEVKEKQKDIEENVEEMLKKHKFNLNQRRKNLQDLEGPSLYSDQIDQTERLTEHKLKVLELVLIDCTEPLDIYRLHTRIKSEVLNKDTFPNIEQTLPRCYHEVETDLQELLKNGDIPQHGIVAQKDLLNELQNRHGALDHEKLKLILQYLHRIGVIMWYKEIPELADSLFVKPSFLISLFKTIVRHDLVKELNAISPAMLKSENALLKNKNRWIRDYEDRATLSNVAIRILVRNELLKLGFTEEELIEEVVGSRKREGNLLSLLKHFDVCLSSKNKSDLDPKASEFHPKKKWVASNPLVYEPDACLFPSYLTNNEQVQQKWGEDNTEDLNIHVYFLPERPHGFFHRLVIRTCTFYSQNWIGKDQCLFFCGNKRVLLREKCNEEDQFIEIRCKHSDLATSTDIQKAWQVIKVIMHRLTKLAEQWQGLCLIVHIPCKAPGCSDYFEWNDWQDWLEDSETDTFNVGLDEKHTCRYGHKRRTELLFPRTPNA